MGNRIYLFEKKFQRRGEQLRTVEQVSVEIASGVMNAESTAN